VEFVGKPNDIGPDHVAAFRAFDVHMNNAPLVLFNHQSLIAIPAAMSLPGPGWPAKV
jgi:hypothetical protein